MKRHESFVNRIFKSKYLKALIIGLLVFAFLVYGGYDRWRKSRVLDYRADRDYAFVHVNKEPITLGDVAYLIMFEEKRTEEQARVYNPRSPKDYWNTSDKGKILSIRVRNTILDMAVHDKIMYDLAIKDGVTLDEKDEKALKNTISDFWDDLYEGQEENCYVSKKVINEEIRKAAIVAKYQMKLAKEAKVNDVRFNYEGEEYQKILKKYKVKVDKSFWRRVRVGEVTLDHDRVNYVQ
ncbi:MAG: hypothetical protein K5851_07135 [Lachnospiraceae bacterium]|nr:hypothetical protein [Lachnospiraceae bacterium]